MNATTTRTPTLTTDIFGDNLTLNFANGKEISIDVTTLHPDIIKQATLHGLKQKLVDSAAIGRDMVTGKSATVDEKMEAVLTVYHRITGENPSWNAIREGGEKTGGLFIRAMMILTGKTKSELDAQLATLAKEQVSALKKNPKVLEIIERIESVKVVDHSASDELLTQLRGV